MSARDSTREVKMIPAVCTQCGGQVEVADTTRKTVCRFCGTTFFVTGALDNSSSIEEKRRARRRLIWGRSRNRIIWFDIALCMAALCFALFLFNTRSMPLSTPAQIRVEYSAAQYNKDKNYQDTINKLKRQGFENIDVVKSRDLVEGSTIHEGHVDYVSIDGKTDFKAGDSFPQNAPVIIYYYSYKD